VDALDCPAYGERALDLGRDRHSICARTRNVAKQAVERPNGASEQSWTPTNQVPLDPIDVDPVRYDEPGIMLEHRQIALQKQRNLADVRRPDDERETHRFIVVLASGALSYGLCKFRKIAIRESSAQTENPRMRILGRAKSLKATASRSRRSATDQR